jgi:hypothetical protein
MSTGPRSIIVDEICAAALAGANVPVRTRTATMLEANFKHKVSLDGIICM